jgi:hypothetical protein
MVLSPVASITNSVMNFMDPESQGGTPVSTSQYAGASAQKGSFMKRVPKQCPYWIQAAEKPAESFRVPGSNDGRAANGVTSAN